VTDSEAENELASTTTTPTKADASKAAEKNDSSARVGDDDDVLNVDCREEVDEFSQFLNDFESELNDSGNVVEKKPKSTSATTKKKKTKMVKKKKLVKRVVVKKRKSKKLDSAKTGLPPTTTTRIEGRDSRYAILDG